MQDGCKRILGIYARKKVGGCRAGFARCAVSSRNLSSRSLVSLALQPDSEALERKVEELKKAHYEAKLRAKLISGTTTPVVGNGASFSPSSRTSRCLAFLSFSVFSCSPEETAALLYAWLRATQSKKKKKNIDLSAFLGFGFLSECMSAPAIPPPRGRNVQRTCAAMHCT